MVQEVNAHLYAFTKYGATLRVHVPQLCPCCGGSSIGEHRVSQAVGHRDEPPCTPVPTWGVHYPFDRTPARTPSPEGVRTHLLGHPFPIALAHPNTRAFPSRPSHDRG